MREINKALAVGLTSALAASCGGGGSEGGSGASGGAPPPSLEPFRVGGFYNGGVTWLQDWDFCEAYIRDSGAGIISCFAPDLEDTYERLQDVIIYNVQINTDGTRVTSGTVDAAVPLYYFLTTPLGEEIPSFLPVGSGSLTGTVDAPDITITSRLYSSNKEMPWQMELERHITHDLRYEVPSSLEAIAGVYTWLNDGAGNMTIWSDGTFFATLSSRCNLNGQVRILDANYNIYAIEYLVSGCTALSDSLNGSTFVGYAVTGEISLGPTVLMYATASIDGVLVGQKTWWRQP